LREVAETLRSRVRVFDSLARYGGEEFVVVMSGATTSDTVRAAERLRVAIQSMEYIPDGQAPHRVTVSIGLTRTARPDVTPQLLLTTADRALYRAKRQGRNRVEIEPLDE
jgi:two-component system cell cycle response regulator